MYSDSDRVIALAGVFQAAKITWQLGRKGVTDSEALDASIRSLFVLHPEDVPSVYGGARGVSLGLRCLLTQLDDPGNRSVEITKYAIALIQLAKKLGASDRKQEQLGTAISDLQSRISAFDLDISTRYAQLGRIYQENISTMSPRIMVQGEPLYLQNTDNAARIRAVLLAGVRAAHLWHQCGGRRWKLVLQRQRIVDSAKELLIGS